MVDWLVLFASVGLFAILVGFTGFLALRLFGGRSTTALVLSPGVGVGVLAAETYVAMAIGHWSWWYVIGGVVFLLIANLIVTRLRKSSDLVVVPIKWPAIWFALLGLALYLLLYLPPVLSQMGYASAPSGLGDGPFHMEGIRLVAETGNVNPIGGLGAIQNPIAPIATYFYSTLWHAIGALFVPWLGVSAASNAVMLLAGTVLWPLSLFALAWSLSQKFSSIGLWSGLLATSMVSFPGMVMFRFSIDAFALSVPVFAYALAALLLLVDEGWYRQGSTYLWAAFLFASLAVASSKLSTAVLLIVALVLALLVAGVQKIVRGYRAGGRVWPTVGAVVVTIVIVASVVGARLVSQELTARYGSYPQPSFSRLATLQRFLNGEIAAAGHVPYLVAWMVVIALAVVGSAFSIKNIAAWMLATMGVFYLTMTVVAAGPESWLRTLLIPWGKGTPRIAPFAMMVVVAFAAYGAVRLVSWIATIRGGQRKSLSAIATVVGVAVYSATVLLPGLGFRISLLEQAKYGYSQDPAVDNFLNRDAMALMEVLDAKFPEGVAVIGAPTSGVRVTSAVSGSTLVFPADPPRSKDQRYLADNFAAIETDPEICRILNDFNGRVLMTIDTAPKFTDEALRYKGIYDVDTSQGFELIGQSGNVQLWEITACQ